MNNLLSPEEARQFLRVSTDDLDQFVKSGKLEAYKISGQYLRFRKEDVLQLKETLFKDQENPIKKNTAFGKLRDFWKFNNFYIFGIIAAVVLIGWLTRGYFR